MVSRDEAASPAHDDDGVALMPGDAAFELRQLAAGDVALMNGLLTAFGEAFDDTESYGSAPPGAEYLARLLADETFIALVALKDGRVVGGLAAYELRKFEQERSEIYIYDLAVAAGHRRQGIATALIRHLQDIAAARATHVIFVQADPGDAPAIALYSGLGRREDVLHFDIPVGRAAPRDAASADRSGR